MYFHLTTDTQQQKTKTTTAEKERASQQRRTNFPKRFSPPREIPQKNHVVILDSVSLSLWCDQSQKDDTQSVSHTKHKLLSYKILHKIIQVEKIHLN